MALVADRMTRDEHIAEAERLARHINGLYLDDSDDAGPRQDYASDADYYKAVEFSNETHSQKLAEMTAWAQLAMVHAKLAEVLGQQPAAPARPWFPTHRGYWTFGPWALIDCTDQEACTSWCLFGPGLGDDGVPTGAAVLSEAQRAADVYIDAWLGADS